MSKIPFQDRTKIPVHQLASVDFQLDNIPKSIQTIPRWVPCYLIGEGQPASTSSKRPIGGAHPEPHQIYSFEKIRERIESSKNHRHFGMTLDESHGLVVIDVDELPEQFTERDLPEPIQELLRDYPTYAEISPSGKGLHICYFSDSSHRRQELVFAKKKNLGRGMKGEIFMDDTFITFTGHKWSSSSLEVAGKDWKELEEAMLGPAKVVDMSTQKPVRGLSAQVGYGAPPSLAKFKEALLKLPATLEGSEAEVPLRECYSQFTSDMTTIDNHEHWRIVIAGANDYGTVTSRIGEMEDAIVEWSAADADNYPGEQPVREKFRANPSKEDGITWKTLLRLANSIQPQWVGWITKRKDGKLIQVAPDPNNVENWAINFKHKGLKLRQNVISKAMFVDGPNDVVNTYFNGGDNLSSQELEISMLHFGQNNGLPKANPGHAKTGARFIASKELDKFDPYDEWINEGKPFNPAGGSELQAIFECIEIPDEYKERTELYRTYFINNMMGLIRGTYYNGPFGGTQGMVILQGPEATYKSTFLSMLLPLHDGAYAVNSQLDAKAPAKEHQIEFANNLVVIKDECASYTKSGDDKVKNLLVQSKDSYRPVYSTDMVDTDRRCIIWGTTNEPKIGITGRGARRFQVIPIKRCDTSKLMKLDIQRAHKEMKYIYDNTPDNEKQNLWVFKAETIAQTNEINNKELRNDQALDLMLKDAFQFNSDYTPDMIFGVRGGLKAVGNPHLMTYSRIASILRERTGQIINLAQLKYSLERLCGDWTDTTTPQMRETGKATQKIDHGYVTNTLNATKKITVSGWVMPLPMADFEKDQLESEEVLD